MSIKGNLIEEGPHQGAYGAWVEAGGGGGVVVVVVGGGGGGEGEGKGGVVGVVVV